MKSISLFTEEMDDLETGVAELVSKYGDFQLLKNSVGIVFAHPDTDFDELIPLLKEHWKFSIVGSTAMSMIVSKRGFATQGITFLIMTADDVEFGVGLTDELEGQDLNQAVAAAYQNALAQMEGKPDIIVTFASVPGHSIGDDYTDALSIASGGVPVFGAMASDDFSFDDCLVFCDGEKRVHGLAVLLLSGNLRPIMEYEYSVSEEASFSAVITEARDNVIYKLGDKSFVDAVREAGIIISEENSFSDCIGTPFVLTYTNEAGDKLTAMRSLVDVNPDGSAIFKGRVPQGAKMNIGLINRTDVHNSVAKVAKKSYHQFYANTKDGKYQYSTVLLVSCASRLMTFANDIRNEADEYIKDVPDVLSVAGMYSFGEMCPCKGDITGSTYNMFYNSTFTLLVI